MIKKSNFLKDTHLAIALIGFISLLFVITFFNWNIQRDDSYIFYSYAKNIVNGDGYVFNIGEKINATTSPLYTLLIATFGFIINSIYPPLLDVSIPIIGHLIGAISLFIICLIFMKTFKAEKYYFISCILPLVFLSNPLLQNSVGMESYLAMMLGILCVYLYTKGQFIAASLSSSFGVLARPDMFLLVLVIIFFDLVINRHLFSLDRVILFLIPIIVWILFSYFYFGTILPSTLSAKLGQTESGRWGTGFIFFKGIISSSIWHEDICRNVFFAFSIAGIFVFLLKSKKELTDENSLISIILIWNLVYILVYGFILNPPAYPWYYTYITLGLSLLITFFIEFFFKTITNKINIRRDLVFITFYISVFFLSLLINIELRQKNVTAKYENYKLAAEWLNDNVKSGTSVGANEIGILRYYYRKGTIIDGLGLVTEGVAEHVRKKEYSWYINEYKPDYLLFNHPVRPVLESMSVSEWFQKDYALCEIIKTPRRAVALYKITK